MQGDPETALLQSVVDAAVTLFDAEAASIAIFERDPDRLEFRVAAGEQGAGVIGLSVPPSKGIAGFVFSTGQPLALSDVMTRPALRPGDGGADGLRAALHRRRAAGGRAGRRSASCKCSTSAPRPRSRCGTWSCSASSPPRRPPPSTRPASSATLDELLRQALGRLAGDELTPEAIDELVSAATIDLDRDTDAPFWGLVDRFARLGAIGEREAALVADLLDLLVRYATSSRRRG